MQSHEVRSEPQKIQCNPTHIHAEAFRLEKVIHRRNFGVQ
jgi:hypothetical protein